MYTKCINNLILFTQNILRILSNLLQDMFDLTKHDKTSGETKEQKEVYESGDYKSVSLHIPRSSTHP